MREKTEMREKTCCFTGHREISCEEELKVRERLRGLLRELVEEGVLYFGVGGALGFDTVAAEEVLKLRDQNPAVRLILVLPCADQAKGWSIANRARYDEIRAAADKVVCLAEHYTRGCMHRRNRHLVDSSSICVAYLKAGRSGGTAYTVRYATEKGLTLINLAD
jgi:uncharacterized phage-like protein YoqJ